MPDAPRSEPDSKPAIPHAQTDEYPVAALAPNIAEPIEHILPHPSEVPSSAPPARPLATGRPRQFTLPMLLALTLAVSLVFSLMQAVEAGVFAAALGLLLTLSALFGMTRTQFGAMLWWTLLAVYSTAVIVLLVTG